MGKQCTCWQQQISRPAWCWPRPKWTARPMRSQRSRRCWNHWTWPGRWSPPTHYADVGVMELRDIHLTGLSEVSDSPGPGRSRALDARRVAPLAWRRGRLCLGLRVGDQVAVAHRLVADSELEQAVEDQPPAGRPAPVEAEAELVEVALQVCVIDPALMGAEEPPLGQGGGPVHPGQQRARILSAGAGRALAAPPMAIAEPSQPVIAHPGVGDHRRSGLDMAGNEWVQRCGGPVADDLHPATPVPVRLPDLDCHADQGFLAPCPP